MLKFSMEFNYSIPSSKTIIIGTLGPSGTSSEEALNYVVSQLQNEQITVSVQLFDNFSALAEKLLNKQIDLALVPHAYDKINEFYMEPKFDLGLIFTYPTPIYGLAKRKDTELDFNGSKIVSHPAPLPLLSKLLPISLDRAEIEVELVNSTSAAAILVKEGLADFAITNEKALNFYDLEFVSTYGRIPMSWSIFHNKKSEEIYV